MPFFKILCFFAFAILSSDVVAGIQENLNCFRARGTFPALGVATVEDGRIESAVSGTRIAGDSTPVGRDDKWHLGSISKSFTALLVATLVNERKMTWKTTVGDVFPEFRAHPDYAKLPIGRLLTHTAGIDDDAIWADERLMERVFEPSNSVSKQRQVLSKAILEKKASRPKAKHFYSNIGIIIVGAMLERLTGQTWERLMEEKVFRRLEMSSCGFGPTTKNPVRPPIQPWAHHRDENGKITPVMPDSPNADNPDINGPAGVIHCSLPDFAKYAKLHLDQIARRPTHLRPESYRPLYQDTFGVNYTQGALSVMRNPPPGGPVFWHDGSNTLNYASMVLDPSSNKATIGVTNFSDDDVPTEINRLVNSAHYGARGENWCSGARTRSHSRSKIDRARR